MGKRQTRIFAKDLSLHLPMLVGQEVNILLKNGIVFHGTIKQVYDSQMYVLNNVGRKHTINLQSIAEVILDKEAFY